MDYVSNVTLCKPREYKNTDGAKYVERYPNHYVLYIPNNISRNEIIQRILQSPLEKPRKRKIQNPNRVNNSFILYRMQKTKDIFEGSPSVNQKIISQKCAEMWKNESDAVKKEYKDKYEILKLEKKQKLLEEQTSKATTGCIKVEALQEPTPTIFGSLFSENNNNLARYSFDSIPFVFGASNPPNHEADKQQLPISSNLVSETEKLNTFLSSSACKHRRSLSDSRLMAELSRLQGAPEYSNNNMADQSFKPTHDVLPPNQFTSTSTTVSYHNQSQTTIANKDTGNQVNLGEWIMQMSSPHSSEKPFIVKLDGVKNYHASSFSQQDLISRFDNSLTQQSKPSVEPNLDLYNDISLEANMASHINAALGINSSNNSSFDNYNYTESKSTSQNFDSNNTGPKDSYSMLPKNVPQASTDFYANPVTKKVEFLDYSQFSNHLPQIQLQPQTGALYYRNLESGINVNCDDIVDYLAPDNTVVGNQFFLKPPNQISSFDASIPTFEQPKNQTYKETASYFYFGTDQLES